MCHRLQTLAVGRMTQKMGFAPCCAKFQVPSSISYRDMEGIPEYKVGAADLPRRPLAVKLLYVAIVPVNACQRTKFQLSSSISFGDNEGGPKIKSGSS